MFKLAVVDRSKDPPVWDWGFEREHVPAEYETREEAEQSAAEWRGFRGSYPHSDIAVVQGPPFDLPNVLPTVIQ